MNVYSILLDAVMLLVLLGCAFYYASRGFFASLLGFFGTLIALIGSFFAANWASPLIFTGLFKTGLEERVAALLNEGAVQTVGQVLKNLFGFLPQSVADAIGAALGESIVANAPGVAAAIVEKAVMPLVVPIITLILFLLLFLVLRVLLGAFSKLLTNVNKIPLLGTGNRLLGFAAGICIGVLYGFLIMCVIWGIDAAYGGGALAQQYLSGSLVYRLTSAFNIFAA
ncbi:hypothetical protein LJC61_00665 [Ruminococcaceae bacterium OttesenSCG-928-A16]|nr:hypothetical protein [Ruminococcaceae bacterium OttesenSCG-928-A16]